MSFKLKVKMDSESAKPLIDKMAKLGSFMGGDDGVKKGVNLASIAKKIAKRKVNKLKNNK